MVSLALVHQILNCCKSIKCDYAIIVKGFLLPLFRECVLYNPLINLRIQEIGISFRRVSCIPNLITNVFYRGVIKVIIIL